MTFFRNLIAWLAFYCYFCGIERTNKSFIYYDNEQQDYYFSSRPEHGSQPGGTDKRRRHLAADARRHQESRGRKHGWEGTLQRHRRQQHRRHRQKPCQSGSRGHAFLRRDRHPEHLRPEEQRTLLDVLGLQRPQGKLRQAAW